MALSAERKEDAARTAFGMIGRTRGQASTQEVAAAIVKKWGGLADFGDHTAVWNIVRGQERAFAAGAAMMTADPNTAVTPRVNDWTLAFAPDLYGYKVEVVIFDPATGSQWRQLYEIGSATPLTPAELLARAEDEARRTATTRRTNPMRPDAQATAIYTPRIVSAGKQPS